MVLANLLSGLRLALSPVVVWSLHRDGGGVLTLALLVVGGVTDLLDGLAARRAGQISRLGKILDPVADKVFIAAVCGGLVAWHGFPAWLLAMQIVRDVSIVSVGARLLRTRGLVISANRVGKASTVVMGATMLGFLLAVPAWLREALIVATAVLLVVSSARYAQQLTHLARTEPPRPG